MQIEDCYFLGTITKAHGYKGELNVHLDTDEPNAYRNLESIFIEKNGLLVPFFLKKAKLHKGNHLRIVIEDFDEPESLIGRSIYLPLESLPELDDDQFYYHEIKNYSMLTEEGILVGEIMGVRDTTAQDLFEINSPDGKEILIPVIDEFIVSIDHNKKTITVSLPDGLLDIF